MLGEALHVERAGLAVHAELQQPLLLPVAPSAGVLSSLHTLAAPCGRPASLLVTAASATPAVGGVEEQVRHSETESIQQSYLNVITEPKL